MRTIAFLVVSAGVIGGAGATVGAAIEPAAYPWVLAGWGACCAAYVAIVGWRVTR